MSHARPAWYCKLAPWLKHRLRYVCMLVQVLAEFLPVSLAGVQCDGSEAGLLDCDSTEPSGNGFVRQQCDEIVDEGITSTVVACANTTDGAAAFP